MSSVGEIGTLLDRNSYWYNDSKVQYGSTQSNKCTCIPNKLSLYVNEISTQAQLESSVEHFLWCRGMETIWVCLIWRKM